MEISNLNNGLVLEHPYYLYYSDSYGYHIYTHGDHNYLTTFGTK